TPVHPDKVPMVPGFGQQPRFIVTIQPAGTLFSPPAQITIPNADGLKPREVTEIYSFDHDLDTFVSIGTATVSDDGTTIRSDPGVGVLKGGWHSGGNSAPTGSAAVCPDCKICQGSQCVFSTPPSGVAITGLTEVHDCITVPSDCHGTFKVLGTTYTQRVLPDNCDFGGTHIEEIVTDVVPSSCVTRPVTASTTIRRLAGFNLYQDTLAFGFDVLTLPDNMECTSLKSQQIVWTNPDTGARSTIGS